MGTWVIFPIGKLPKSVMSSVAHFIASDIRRMTSLRHVKVHYKTVLNDDNESDNNMFIMLYIAPDRSVMEAASAQLAKSGFCESK